MIYRKDGETLDHVADNRLMSTQKYQLVNNTLVNEDGTAVVYSASKRDNLLKQMDYSDYEVKHITKGVIDCYNEDELVYSFTFDMAESDYKAYGSTNSGKAIFMTNPTDFVIPDGAQNVTTTVMGELSLTTSAGILTSAVRFQGLRWRTVVGTSVVNPEFGYTYGKAFFMNGDLTEIVSRKDVFQQNGPGSWTQIDTNFVLPGTTVHGGRMTKFVTKKVEYDLLTNEEI